MEANREDETNNTSTVQNRPLYRPKQVKKDSGKNLNGKSGGREIIKNGEMQKVDSSSQVPETKKYNSEDSIDHNIELLKTQVELALRGVNTDRIQELNVGQTKISNDRAVILSWGRGQTFPPFSDIEDDVPDDGLVLYVAIKYKQNQNVQEDENNNSDDVDQLIDTGQAVLESSAGESAEGVKRDKEKDEEGCINKVNDPETGNGFIPLNTVCCSTDEHQSTSLQVPSSPLKSSKNGRKRHAKENWRRLLTTMRGVDSNNCENLFLKDEYSRVRVEEDEIEDIIDGSFQIKTPNISEEDDTPSKKRVTWREELEETRDLDEILQIDLDRVDGPEIQHGRNNNQNSSSSRRGRPRVRQRAQNSLDSLPRTPLSLSSQQMHISSRRDTSSSRRDTSSLKRDTSSLRRDTNSSRPDTNSSRHLSNRDTLPRDIKDLQKQSTSSVKHHRGMWAKKSGPLNKTSSTNSVPNSPTKSPLHVRTRSCSIERASSLDNTAAQYSLEYSANPDSDSLRLDRIRRVRSRHKPSSSNLWLVGGLDSFNSRVSNRFVSSLDENPDSQYYFFRSLPRLSASES
ncbi:uncharacterized protein LOC111712731 isoform X2 [Eurytemora carolleeae]|uniref:uncharacterized protein LOC111712731 isoform X2 n=1 Tax=Eurytemora carolleeae TaxID=1294199 RepID=UPI000C78DFAB|nr:uncharacterized protein LOC111712731 isoform X2 [Eurytemora carolleeae]|eukprot:XP_023343204.1 uncharacterized protein LOC111712731 isoform X2 [Eurytemora affinis]